MDSCTFPLSHLKPQKLFCPWIAESFSFCGLVLHIFNWIHTHKKIIIINFSNFPKFLLLSPLRGLGRQLVCSHGLPPLNCLGFIFFLLFSPDVKSIYVYINLLSPRVIQTEAEVKIISWSLGKCISIPLFDDNTTSWRYSCSTVNSCSINSFSSNSIIHTLLQLY